MFSVLPLNTALIQDVTVSFHQLLTFLRLGRWNAIASRRLLCRNGLLLL
jgi:hypothetical protein